MPGDPESPPTPPNNRLELAESQKPEKPRTSIPKETQKARDVVERVPECPIFRRQMLFTRPFTVYGDIIDAETRTGGRKENDVPAIYHVLDTTKDGSQLCVGDDTGKRVGWILKNDNPGYEWNVKSVFIPCRRSIDAGRMPFHVQPASSSAHLNLEITATTILPLLETQDDANGNTWYKVGPSFTATDGAHAIRKPMWIPDRDYNGTPLREFDNPTFLMTEKDILDSVRALTLTLAEFESRGKDGTEKYIFALQRAYLRLLGATALVQTDDSLGPIRKYLTKYNVSHEILDDDAWLNQPIGRISKFKQTLQLLQAQSRVAATGAENVNYATGQILINGRPERLYAVTAN